MLGTEDRLSIESLLYRAFWLVDNGRAAEVAELFAPDAAWTFGPGTPKPGTVSGDDISQFLIARQAQTQITTRHVLSNVLIEPLADGAASARSLLTLFRADGGEPVARVASVADIVDRLERRDGKWKIVDRLITPVFHA